MHVDEQGIIKILSITNPIKIIEYNLTDQSCNDFLFKELSGDRFYPYNDGYLFFSPNGSEQATNRFFLFVTDSTGRIRNKWLPSHDYIQYSLRVNAFSSYDDTILFNKHFDNQIYQIFPNENISVRYSLNFDKYQIPKKVKESFQKEFSHFLKNTDDYILSLDFFYETRNLLVFSYLVQQGGTPFFNLYVKDRKELIVLMPKDDLGIAISAPVNLLEDGYFISFIDVSEFLFDKSSLYEEYRNRMYKNYFGLQSAVTMLHETSNPILIKYKFKTQ
jgi:hypothetical protein